MKLAAEPFVKGGIAIYEFGGNAISVALEEIDPITSSQYLDTSSGNRSISNADRYALDMKSNKWFTTGETIIFDDDNQLMDGHNRLTACRDSGKSFVSFVVRGIPAKYRAFIDTGKSRSLIDVLNMMNNIEKYEQGVGYVVKRLVCLEKKRPISSHTVTTRSEELIALSRDSREIVRVVEKVYTTLQQGQQRNMMSFLTLWFGRKYPRQMDVFLNKLGAYDTEGYVTNPSCPVHQLAKVFESGKFSGKAVKRAATFQLAFASINMFLAGKTGNIAPAAALRMHGYPNERLDGGDLAMAAVTGA